MGDGAGGATGVGLIDGAKENADGAEGVSEGGLEANEKPEDPDPNAVDATRVAAEGAEAAHVFGTENVNDDEDIEDVGAMLNDGAADEAAAGAGGGNVIAEVTLR